MTFYGEKPIIIYIFPHISNKSPWNSFGTLLLNKKAAFLVKYLLLKEKLLVFLRKHEFSLNITFTLSENAI
jgi:hypothetical protein